MGPSRPEPELGRKQEILVFGPQLLSFDGSSAEALRFLLVENQSFPWIRDALQELPSYWETAASSFPSFRASDGKRLLENLATWLRTGNLEVLPFPWCNTVLTPVVVALHLTQYLNLIGNDDSSEPMRPLPKISETVGLCTGHLSASAVSCAKDRIQLEHYGAVAIRLAMLIGTLVDSKDALMARETRASSLSVTWDSANDGVMEQILTDFPGAYISIRQDERRVTVTTPSESVSPLLHTFQSLGFGTLKLRLCGYFHWKNYGGEVDALIGFCDQNPQLCFASSPDLSTPTRSTVTGEHWTLGPLNHHVIKAILSETSDWKGVFDKIFSSRSMEDVHLTTIGPEPCVPLFATRGQNVNFTQINGPKPNHSKDSTRRASVNRYPSIFDDTTSCDYIAVTGMACRLPGAADVDEFWSLLCAGESQHQEVPSERFPCDTPWRKDDRRRKWFGNFIKDYDQFDEKFFGKGPRESAYMDPQNRLLLEVAYQAVEQAGYFRRSSRSGVSEGKQVVDEKCSIGCYIGVGLGDYEHNVACHPPTAYTAVGNLRAFVAGRISHYFGWSGPSQTIDTACSSSAVAVHSACRAILGGECHAALVGGVNVMTSPDWFQNLAAASFLSPTGQCKPFDSKADGYCRGEAVSAVYLKKLSSALEDGDVIHGVIVGSAVNQSQNTTPITVPNVPSLVSLFNNAIRLSRLHPGDISYVEAHGTGTPLGDPVEYEGIRQVLCWDNGRHDTLSLGSVKGLIGHSEAASGVVALLKTLLMMHHKCIPPQASFHTLRPDINPRGSQKMSIWTRPTPWNNDFKAALINNYGASGSNAAIIVTQAPRATSNRQTVSKLRTAVTSLKIQTYPLALFAFDKDGLARYAARLLSFLGSRDDLSASDLAFQINRQSNWSLPHSLIFSFGTIAELMEKLDNFCHSKAAAADAGNVTKPIVGHTIPPPRPVILCFGGQTSNLVGLDDLLYTKVKILRKYLDDCNRVSVSLGEGIYPDIFQDTPVRDIVRLQLAIFSLQYACAKSWISCGVKVSAVVGHSFGELTALCISGVLSLPDALAVVAGRARLVRDHWGADKGSMLAVKADRDIIEKWLVESCSRCPEQPAASIACFNGGRSFTVAGSTKAIDAAFEVALSNEYSSSMAVRRLDVTHAFHSSLVDPIYDSLRNLNQGVIFNEPIIPIELATETGNNEQPFKNFLSEHMRRPVYFGQAVQRLSRTFPSAVWLEAGSSSALITMVSRVLGKITNTHFQPVNIAGVSEAMQNLTETTVRLWRQGLDVTFWPHHKEQADEHRPLLLPPYQFKDSRHWMELKVPPLTTPRTEQSRLSAADPHALWALVSVRGKLEDRTARFTIHMHSERFKDILRAHKVLRTHLLCPSTVQLHIVIDALTSLAPEYADSTMQPRVLGMNSHAPITSQSEGRVTWLDASMKNAADHVWEWALISENAQDGGRLVHHSSGAIAFHQEDDREILVQFSEHEALVYQDHTRHLLNDWDVDEILQGRSIYRSFSEIVEYGDMFCHLRKLAGEGNESAGRVTMTFSGDSWMDFSLADCFCQVAGIYINMTGERTAEEFFISNKIGQWTRSPRIRYEKIKPRVWEVFARHHQTSPREFVSDIFVFDGDYGSLLEVIIGVHYQKVAKLQLGKALLKVTEEDSAGTLSTTSGLVKEVAGRQLNNDGAIPSIAISASTQPTGGLGFDVSSIEGDVKVKLRQLVANISGLALDEIRNDSGLSDIGIDSLMVMELAREIENMFECRISLSQVQGLDTFQSLVSFVHTSLGPSRELRRTPPAIAIDQYPADDGMGPAAAVSISDVSLTTGHSAQLSITRLPTNAVLGTFCELKTMTDDYVFNHGLVGYVESVLPTLDLVCLFYIRKAFKQLGIDYSHFCNGSSQKKDNIPGYLPRHEKLVDLFQQLLQHHSHPNGGIDDTQEPEALMHHLRTVYPAHSHDYNLIELVGSKLPDCLSGDSEGVQILFGSAEGREIVSAMYGQSPINLVWISQLRDWLQGLLCRMLPITTTSACEPLRILEVGAGTTATSAQIIPVIAQLGVPVLYTVTDISSSLVAAARKRFKNYEWVSYRVLDLEKSVPTELLESQHIVLATNCVHATKDIVGTTRRLRNMLRPDGALLMLEMTQRLMWVDLIFGLLEGWWQFEDGRSHALVPASMWNETLLRAGYGHVHWTEGKLPEAGIQRLILATASRSRQQSNSIVPSSPTPKTDVDHNGVEHREAVIENYVRDFTTDIPRLPPLQVDGLPRSEQGHAAVTTSSASVVVLIIGATGNLGSHLVQSFAKRSEIRAIICLNRENGHDASFRQRQALESRGIHLDTQAAAKLQVYQTDTASFHLGLSDSAYDDIARRVTHVVYNAWPMSISRPVQAFEAQFKTMRNLIMLGYQTHGASSLQRHQAGSSSGKLTLQFVSSIAAVGMDPARTGGPLVAEEPMPVSSALPNGYGEAKLVCERMLHETLGRHPEWFRPMTVRLGQISGSLATGYWNPVEHFPSMVKSSQAMGCLPQLQGTLSWCSATDCAASLATLLLSPNAVQPIYHIENPCRYSWPAVIECLGQALGIPRSQVVPFTEWLSCLRQPRPAAEIEDIPAARIVEFLERHFVRMSCGGVVLDMTNSLNDCPSLGSMEPVDEDLVKRYVQSWQEMGFLST